LLFAEQRASYAMAGTEEASVRLALWPYDMCAWLSLPPSGHVYDKREIDGGGADQFTQG
jgi:hypothetical protein